MRNIKINNKSMMARALGITIEHVCICGSMLSSHNQIKERNKSELIIIIKIHIHIKTNVTSKSMNNITRSIMINIKINMNIMSELTRTRRIQIMRSIPICRHIRSNINSDIKIIRNTNNNRVRKRKLTRNGNFRLIVRANVRVRESSY